jgi:hypothetical protein
MAKVKKEGHILRVDKPKPMKGEYAHELHSEHTNSRWQYQVRRLVSDPRSNPVVSAYSHGSSLLM